MGGGVSSEVGRVVRLTGNETIDKTWRTEGGLVEAIGVQVTLSKANILALLVHSLPDKYITAPSL